MLVLVSENSAYRGAHCSAGIDDACEDWRQYGHHNGKACADCSPDSDVDGPDGVEAISGKLSQGRSDSGGDIAHGQVRERCYHIDGDVCHCCS